MPDQLVNSEIQDWKPRPDPTVLTTQQLAREITNLKELITGRLDRMDKAQELFENNLTRVPTETQRAVGTAQALMEAKVSEVYTTIRSLSTLIDEKFILRDKGVKETADLTSTALQAALAASEKSSNRQTEWFTASALKTESSFTKTMDQQDQAVSSLSGALTDKLNDLKDRLTAQEARAAGMGHLWGWIVGALGLVFSGISILIAFVVYLSHSNVTAVAPIVIPK